MKNLEGLCIRHKNNRLELLDQQALPHEETWVEVNTPDEMVECIRQLKVRGAPAIGVAAALSVAKYAESGAGPDDILKAARELRASRPTAVNLMWALDRQVLKADPKDLSVEKLVQVAEEIFVEDVELCEKMANYGAEFIQDGESILTHCNTGGLATAGIGTALGVIRRAHESGKKIHVYVDETRPLLQGGRLTTWELEKLGIPYTLICDNMAGFLMKQGKIQRVFLGADRIAANGDFANKVGTYSVAVLARHHEIPFYTVAPTSTVDLSCESGQQIPIEERNAVEVHGVRGQFGEALWAPKRAETYNPAFDVTPAELVTGYVLSNGYFSAAEVAAHGIRI